MYHGRFRKSHYETGFNWGNLLFKNHKKIDQNSTFEITKERKTFAKECLPVYEKYYPEILEEIRGLADGQKGRYEDFYTFLLSMYCFEFNNHCTCFAFKDKDNLIFGRNSDFLVALEKLYMNCLYKLNGVYGFMCQYERNKGADTVWSVIYDIKNKRIFRVEGNPSRKKFVEDTRMKFI
ncbi:MAG TPA: hypothetical protein DDY31_07035 [Lachnospiraceae bacterium]|nr:hypothetical protein [Lachnospiraceae bacterium]